MITLETQGVEKLPLPHDVVHQLDEFDGPAKADTGDLTKEVASYVAQHPALCFATAFVVGVTCAWWLKQT